MNFSINLYIGKKKILTGQKPEIYFLKFCVCKKTVSDLLTRSFGANTGW